MRVGVKLLLVAVAVDGGRRPDRLLRLEPDDARGLARLLRPRPERQTATRSSTSRSRPSPPSARSSARTPTGSRTSSGTLERAVEARDGLGPARARDRPRHDLQLRRRERPAQPVLRPAAGHGRQPHPRRREAGRARRPERGVAHVRRARARAHPRDPGRRRRREEPVRLRAVRDVDTRTGRSSSRSTRRRRATTAGSASSPARPGWIYGFGGPMQTIGYMDGFLNVQA